MFCQYKHRFEEIMSRSSSVLKMLSDVPENRKVKNFGKAYSTFLTPHMITDFDSSTKGICKNKYDVLASLKICKVIIIGDVCVGKTCIVNRFCHQVFESNYKATIGVDFEVEKFEILGVPFNLQIWDTAGQERFKCIAQSYYRCSNAVIVVFDVTNISTLSHCKNWMKEAQDTMNYEPFKFLVGTKIDQLSKASYKVVETYAEKVAKGLNAEYWPVSSKSGENIDKLFLRIACITFNDIIEKDSQHWTKTIKIGSDLVSLKKQKKKSKSRNKNECGKCNNIF